LLGPPGVGKGTQAEKLAPELGTCHLSTGDVFRQGQIVPDGQRSPALDTALGAMRRGELVSDDIVIDMVRERAGCLRCRGGFLLDGFPRTVAQAEALDSLLEEQGTHLDAAVYYTVPRQTLIERLSGRRTCPSCNAVFHIASRPPRLPGICDDCSGRLVQRADDCPESISVRLAAYDQNTTPLIDYYRKTNRLLVVEADGPTDTICMRTLALLAEYKVDYHDNGDRNARPATF